jgi:signal transduction histidine kinase
VSRNLAELRPEADIEGAIASFTHVLQELRDGHQVLQRRAERVEAELQARSRELAAKVQELDRVNRRLETILASLPTGVVVRDASGRVTLANEAALEILGRDALEVEGSRGTFGPPVTGAGPPAEYTCPDGTRRVVAVLRSELADAQGKPLGAVEILDDRTALSALTEQVHTQAKVAALGTVAGGIAHELRNPMNAIRGFAELLAREVGADSKAARWSANIVQGVREADAIITSTLAFADPERLAPEPVSAGELVADALDLVRGDLLGDGTFDRYRISGEVEERTLMVDRIQLRQALRNLIANALEAQPEGGAVRVSLACRGGDALFTVADAGPGFTPEQRARARDPFYTTRADGTGLGLALVHTIAELHGGALEIAPTPSAFGGAEVTLRVPLAPHTQASSASRSPASR